MGKVWRAHHTALKRDDALKVLPDAFAAAPERVRRLRREAQVLASLNYLNISHVYDLEQSDDVQALVMELLTVIITPGARRCPAQVRSGEGELVQVQGGGGDHKGASDRATECRWS
jgi:hypothetical protein